MEKADNVFTIPADIGWSDIESWASLYGAGNKDEDDNAVNCQHVHLEQTSNCISKIPKNKAAVIKGLENYIVVDDEKVLLIYPKSNE